MPRRSRPASWHGGPTEAIGERGDARRSRGAPRRTSGALAREREVGGDAVAVVAIGGEVASAAAAVGQPGLARQRAAGGRAYLAGRAGLPAGAAVLAVRSQVAAGPSAVGVTGGALDGAGAGEGRLPLRARVGASPAVQRIGSEVQAESPQAVRSGGQSGLHPAPSTKDAAASPMRRNGRVTASSCGGVVGGSKRGDDPTPGAGVRGDQGALDGLAPGSTDAPRLGSRSPR